MCLLGSSRHQEGISKEKILSLWSQNKEAKGWKACVLYLRKVTSYVVNTNKFYFGRNSSFFKLLTEFPLFSIVVSSDHLFLLFFC